MTTDQQYKQIIIRKCPANLKRRLAIRAAETGQSQQSIILEASGSISPSNPHCAFEPWPPPGQGS